MAEIKELNKINLNKLPQINNFRMETLYKGIYKNLHFEMGFKKILYLLSPYYTVLSPDKIPAEVEDFLNKKGDLLDYLKLFLMKNLISYSFLVEAHSYYIEQNDYTVIARFRERNGEKLKFEIKYYTNSQDHIVDFYEDKIYIGRDFINLNSITKKRCGLTEHIESIPYEINRLFEKANDKLHDKSKNIFNYLDDMKNIGKEFYGRGIAFMESIPDDFNIYADNDSEILCEVSKNMRILKHRLLEIKEDLNELINLLRKKEELDFVRYIVKFRTDIVNLINFLNFKIIGRIVDNIE
jgi:hypothetical protein